MNIITCEKIQQLANVYIGLDSDFNINPIIKRQSDKHLNINRITVLYDNPSIVFCYPDRIELLSTKIVYFQNNFTLITCGSDMNFYLTPSVQKIVDCGKLKKWYCQNLCFEHPSIQFLPIGLANVMYPHGNLTFFTKNYNYNKKYNVYFQFLIQTNRSKRMRCFNALKNKIRFLPKTDPFTNLCRVALHKFCICPEGNGIDTHRFWEALYVKTVPIVLKNPLIDIIIRSTSIPIVVLNNWNELNINTLDYTKYDFSSIQETSFEYYSKLILSTD